MLKLVSIAVKFLCKLKTWLFLGWLLACLSTVAFAQYEPEPESYYSKHQVHTLDFTADNTIALGGDWLFYPNHLLRDPNTVLRAEPITLPSALEKGLGSNRGYGTYIAHFRLPQHAVGRRVAIKIPHQYGAYKVFLNGDLLVRAGEVNADLAKIEVEKAPKIAYFVANDAYFTLSIQVANASELHGGLENPLRIGLARNINRQFQQQQMSIAAVCGAVLGVSLFTLLFSLFRGPMVRESQKQFVFGLFILFLALHNLFTAPYAYTAFTTIDWKLGARLEYLFSYIAILFFLSYIYMLKRKYLHRYIYGMSVVLLSINMGAVCVLEPEQFNQLGMYCAIFCLPVIINLIYGFSQTLKFKESYSVWNLWAVIFLCSAFLNDFLLMANVIDSVYLSFVATSLYALLIMFQQSRNYAFYTYHTEQLNTRLRELNSSLDQKVKSRTEELHNLNAKLELQVKTDALTGAFNRYALNHEIQQLFDQTPTYSDKTLIFAMLDVDYFKNYNDYYGHLKGDVILQSLVKVLKQSLPETAFLARYGGEEFAIVMHNVPIPVAEQYLLQVLDAVRQQQFEHLNRSDGKDYVTLSIGVAYKNREHPYANIHELMKAADVQLYAAKQAGRDQLKVSPHQA